MARTRDAAPTGVLVVHPEPLVGRAMAQFLRLQPGVGAVHFVRGLADAAEHLREAGAPAVVLVHEGLLAPALEAFARTVRPPAPRSRFLLLTDPATEQRGSNPPARSLARQARMDGVVSGDQPLAALAQAVGAAIRGPLPDIGEGAAMATLGSVTPRQHQVLELLLQGHSNKLIARQLDITESTVKEYVSALLKKFDVKRRAELMAQLQQL
ncbi:LuxR C-terminal-related transcriptional regulator [Ottowia sp.]|uniref:helix-turn-helix transcriptional regulator n=1 Tax=Ottowia sp. TaxID=1898956 RepID=UPI002620C3D0|nr:LuxR C-terminal-related transcriptional regulator [Ottowia sp.]